MWAFNSRRKQKMRINHNIAALNTQRSLTGANNAQSKSMEKLSSGLRINRAGDDAAGLAISEKMRAQVRGLDQAVRNSQDGISLIQTTEGALNETHAILQRMRELAVQAGNDTNTAEDRAEIGKEINQLSTEITRISTDTEFNEKVLLNGDFATDVIAFQVGANSGQKIEINIAKLDAAELAVDTLGVATNDEAGTSLDAIDAAIQTVSAERSMLGAVQNRLEHTINNLGTASENLTAAESRIRDVDMAKEISEQTKQSILSQAAQAMLAQANQTPQGVLQLLR